MGILSYNKLYNLKWTFDSIPSSSNVSSLIICALPNVVNFIFWDVLWELDSKFRFELGSSSSVSSEDVYIPLSNVDRGRNGWFEDAPGCTFWDKWGVVVDTTPIICFLCVSVDGEWILEEKLTYANFKKF